MNKKTLLTALAVPFALAACDMPFGPSAGTDVSVRFGTSTTSATPSLSSPFLASATTDGLLIEGSNGSLHITDVSFIVSELELECEEDDEATDAAACAEFEAPMSFVKLPLPSGAVEVTSQPIPAGSYTELEFAVENVEADEDDDASEREQVAALLEEIRTTHGFDDFPSQASMVVVGTFTPTGGSAVPFRTYFQAELEVEMELSPALDITESGASRALSVDVQPALWFVNADGTVKDLAKLDYATTQSLVEFEVEMEHGFSKVEFDD